MLCVRFGAFEVILHDQGGEFVNELVSVGPTFVRLFVFVVVNVLVLYNILTYVRVRGRNYSNFAI